MNDISHEYAYWNVQPTRFVFSAELDMTSQDLPCPSRQRHDSSFVSLFSVATVTEEIMTLKMCCMSQNPWNTDALQVLEAFKEKDGATEAAEVFREALLALKEQHDGEEELQNKRESLREFPQTWNRSMPPASSSQHLPTGRA